jgi:hypothetical protein
MMENKKLYEKPEMEVLEMQVSSELLEGSCDGNPCPDDFDVNL